MHARVIRAMSADWFEAEGERRQHHVAKVLANAGRERRVPHGREPVPLHGQR
jgi:hypothetical protein